MLKGCEGMRRTLRAPCDHRIVQRALADEIVPGRTCPAEYRYGAAALARPADLHVDCLWVAGGLYGNSCALDTLLEAFDAERASKALVFNGDFHWFDVAPGDFAAINDTVLGFRATRGNVETELARSLAGAGCGCGYPEWVDDETVHRSNRIIERLRNTARLVPGALERLAGLPMHLRVDIGNQRVAVVHGDADSLAGWDFSQETLASDEGMRAAQASLRRAQVDIFASSHTCLPVLQQVAGGVIVNNGAAGMPNFAGELYGLATRIALAPSGAALFGTRAGAAFVEAIPLRYDVDGWRRRFIRQWPRGSDAHASYFARISAGPRYRRVDALRVS
jgi:predicted phosphodiesterase